MAGFRSKKWLVGLAALVLVGIILWRMGKRQAGQGPGLTWRITRRLNRRAVAVFRSGRAKQIVLLLTTIGRKSGLPRTTPLQYEEIDSVLYVGAARGPQADWFRNIQADPHVEVQRGAQRFRTVAEPITDPARIVDFLQVRLKRHPRMVGAMLLTHGLPFKPSRAHLEQLARQLAIVAIPLPRP